MWCFLGLLLFLPLVASYIHIKRPLKYCIICARLVHFHYLLISQHMTYRQNFKIQEGFSSVHILPLVTHGNKVTLYIHKCHMSHAQIHMQTEKLFLENSCLPIKKKCIPWSTLPELEAIDSIYSLTLELYFWFYRNYRKTKL